VRPARARPVDGGPVVTPAVVSGPPTRRRRSHPPGDSAPCHRPSGR